MANKPTNSSAACYNAVIAGTGAFLPEKTLTNDDLTKIVDTSDEWITSRTGIKTRRVADEKQTTATLATEAAKIALADAKLDPLDIDLIIVACFPKQEQHGCYPPVCSLLLSDGRRIADLLVGLCCFHEFIVITFCRACGTARAKTAQTHWIQ